MKDSYFNIGDKLRCITEINGINIQEECNITRISKHYINSNVEYMFEISSENEYFYDFSYKSLAIYFDVKTLERKKKLEIINRLVK